MSRDAKKGSEYDGTDSVESLNKKLLEHVGFFLAGLDIVYSVILYLTASNPWLTVFAAILFPGVNLPFLKLSNKTGIPFIKYSATVSLSFMFLVTYWAGPSAPGWLLCFSAITASQLMIDSKMHKGILISGFIVTALSGSYFAGQDLQSLAIVFVTLLAFTVIQIRVFGYLVFQNQKLEDANILARQASLAKGRFLANMSHEIRTPMNGVLGTLQLLKETNLSPEQRDYVDMIGMSGQNLVTIINDILDFSKIEADALVLEQAAFDLHTCVESVITAFTVQISEKNLTLNHTIDRQIPKTLVGDVTRLSQVLTNLVSNAIKFTSEGSVAVSVRQTRQDNNEIELLFAVQDTGIGIPKQRCDHIFDAFTQADETTTRKYGGTGLGLAISRQLVELMGGNIRVESEEGKGTTFSFTLKTRQASDIERPGATKTLTAIDAELGERLPLNILLAEDNLINQKLTLRLLAKMGYKADLVENGQAVLDALNQRFYDLIFMDIQMPGMDGIEATQEIRRRWPAQQGPIIIALTANVMMEDIDKCRIAGMDDFLGKPIELSEIQDRIQKWGSFAKREEQLVAQSN